MGLFDGVYCTEQNCSVSNDISARFKNELGADIKRARARVKDRKHRIRKVDRGRRRPRVRYAQSTANIDEIEFELKLVFQRLNEIHHPRHHLCERAELEYLRADVAVNACQTDALK